MSPDQQTLESIAAVLDEGPPTESQCASFAAKLREVSKRWGPRPQDGPPVFPPTGP
jgi:hypothetical protein